jgi:DnaJ-class molecular chaperone
MGSMINNMMSSLAAPPGSQKGGMPPFPLGGGMPPFPLGGGMPPPSMGGSGSPDTNVDLDLTLMNLYKGKKKKIGVQRKRLNGKMENKKVNITIHPGMKDGDKIRLNNYGDEIYQGKFADLVININMVPGEIKDWVRFGDDLIITKEISLFESLFDCSVKLNTITGEEIILPKKNDIISNNTLRKIEGHGMPIYGTTENGDLYVLFKVNSEYKKITNAQKESLRKIFTPVTDDWKSKVTDDKLKLLSDIDLNMTIQPSTHDDESDDESDSSDEYDSDDSNEQVETKTEERVVNINQGLSNPLTPPLPIEVQTDKEVIVEKDNTPVSESDYNDIKIQTDENIYDEESIEKEELSEIDSESSDTAK